MNSSKIEDIFVLNQADAKDVLDFKTERNILC